MTDRKRIRLVVQTISYRIDRMLNDKSPKTFFQYSGENIVEVVDELQREYRGDAVISRTPTGIVAHISPAARFDGQRDVSDEMLFWSMPPIRVASAPLSGKARK